MKIGIIAEYNPFHNGHAYQLQYIREKYSPEGIFIAMSGNFVQRGEPAAFDKYVRAEAALKNGADLVFELPHIFALSSAQGFAASGVKTLFAAGCDTLVCGAEDPDFAGLSALLDAALYETAEYKALLREGLDAGMTYPATRAKAFSTLLPGAGIEDYLCKPNNLLAFEYSLAARKFAPELKIIMLPRKGAGHGDGFATGCFAPASYLRGLLVKGSRESLAEFYGLIPDNVKPLYNTADFMSWPDFDAVLYDRLIKLTDLAADDDLIRRIINNISEYRGAADFIGLIKTKNITYTAASRAMLHIILGYRDIAKDTGVSLLPYIRLLGMKKGADKLLSQISSKLPGSGAELFTALPQDPSPLLDRHIKNDMLYEGIRALRSGTPIKNEYQRKFLVVEQP